MNTLELSKGYVSIVDENDYPELSKTKWSYNGCGYAIRAIWNPPKKKNHYILLHRQIMNPAKGQDVDHIKGNKLDNRRANLRLCSRSQNKANVGLKRTNTSGFKGVSFFKQTKRWRARIKVDYKATHLGFFPDKESAAKAYDAAAILHFGRFAQTNF
jgi:hypothetical protein